ncbi:hypothetical protein C0J52_13818 [Blattella germanica]|nr:hypothetical protein C0J52_13818 [Blattella germanica]
MSDRHSRGKKLTRALAYICLQVLRPQDEISQKYKREFQKFFDKLIQLMKDEDELFEAIYNGPSYQGSTFENTKIIVPNEYDVNLELVLTDCFYIEIEEQDTYPGFARVRLNRKRKVKDRYMMRKIMEEWLDDEDYICQNEVLNWLKSVVDRALNKMDNDNVVRRESGPAITVYVTTNEGDEFSVDLVPALYLGTEYLPRRQYNILMRMCRDIDISDLGWHLVPKRARDEWGRQSDDVTQWRMSFYLYERRFMQDLYGYKPTFRLLKWFRDRQKWTRISSYYLKTLFLWELKRKGSDFWKKTAPGELFLHMLDCLRQHLDNKRIAFFWDKKCNLIGHLPDDYLERTYDDLDGFISDLEDALDNQDENASAETLGEMFNITLDKRRIRNSFVAKKVNYLYHDLINNSKRLVL